MKDEGETKDSATRLILPFGGPMNEGVGRKCGTVDALYKRIFIREFTL
jgi:hypothetical protein